MSNITINQKNMSMNNFLANKIDQSEIDKRLQNNDIVLIPEVFMDKECINIDLINLVKTLRKQGVTVDTSLTKDVVEKRAADIVLVLGIIGEKVALPLFLGMVGRYLYDRFVKNKEKKDVPTVRVGYYKKDSEEYVKYEGPADELSDALQKLRDDKNG